MQYFPFGISVLVLSTPRGWLIFEILNKPSFSQQSQFSYCAVHDIKLRVDVELRTQLEQS